MKPGLPLPGLALLNHWHVQLVAASRGAAMKDRMTSINGLNLECTQGLLTRPKNFLTFHSPVLGAASSRRKSDASATSRDRTCLVFRRCPEFEVASSGY